MAYRVNYGHDMFTFPFDNTKCKRPFRKYEQPFILRNYYSYNEPFYNWCISNNNNKCTESCLINFGTFIQQYMNEQPYYESKINCA